MRVIKFYLALHFADYISCTAHQMPRHQQVENSDDTERYHVVDEEATY